DRPGAGANLCAGGLEPVAVVQRAPRLRDLREVPHGAGRAIDAEAPQDLAGVGPVESAVGGESASAPDEVQRDLGAAEQRIATVYLQVLTGVPVADAFEVDVGVRQEPWPARRGVVGRRVPSGVAVAIAGDEGDAVCLVGRRRRP